MEYTVILLLFSSNPFSLLITPVLLTSEMIFKSTAPGLTIILIPKTSLPRK